jgi:hypothetical protein
MTIHTGNRLDKTEAIISIRIDSLKNIPRLCIAVQSFVSEPAFDQPRVCIDVFLCLLAYEVEDWHNLIAAENSVAHLEELSVIYYLLFG